MSRESATDEGRAAIQISVAIAAPSPRTEVGNSRLRVDACSAGATLSHFAGEGNPQPVDCGRRFRAENGWRRLRRGLGPRRCSNIRRNRGALTRRLLRRRHPLPLRGRGGARTRLRSSSARKQRFTPAAWARSSDCVATVPFASVVPGVREVADVGGAAWPDRRAPERIVGRPVDSGQIRVHALT